MNRPYYRYTRRDALTELQRIDLDIGSVLVIEGNPDWASYEWRIEGPGGGLQSDCGYGNPAIALRDGLIAYYGLPGADLTGAPGR